MRKIVSFLFLSGLAANLISAEPKWQTDFEAVKQQAQKENKVVLMDFTGSDWCPPCKALKKNVFNSADFAKFAEQKLVLMELDFPNDKSKLTKEIEASNEKMSKKFKITGYPTIIVLDRTGKEVGRSVGYGGETPAAYIKKLEGFIAKAK
jgi:thioredoxin-related protein